MKRGDLGARRLAAEHGVTRALAGARSLEEAAPGILEAICGSLGWDAGAFWQRDPEEGDLFCAEVWYSRSDLRSFEEVTARTRLAPGKGLPGRVWDTRRPVWIPDLASDPHIVRRELSAVLGLRTALAFPVLVEREILGVLELFYQRPAEPDEPLLGMVEAIGSEIGQFVKRTRAEAALRESEERLRIALEAGRMGTWDWDLLAGRLRWSEGLERIYGFPSGSFGGTLDEFLGAIHPEDRKAVMARITADLEGRTEHHAEFRILRPDGSLCWIERRGQILLDEAGRPVRMIGVSMDVTERKRNEEEMRLLAETSSVLAAGTRQAVQARDQVLAVVSHDLRNLLDPISMNAAQLLEDTPAGSLARRPLERIRRAVGQMDRLIHDLLDVASIEAGRLVLLPERLDPADLIAEALEAHRTAAERKSRRLVGAVPPDLPWIEGDRYRLLQVFANLVGNALKFTPLEGTVTVGAERLGAGEVRFFVADTGPGILEGDLPHLFEAYWKSPSHREPGSGLGLAICERIVTAHGGRIWVESEPGAGSVFSFSLGRRPGE